MNYKNMFLILLIAFVIYGAVSFFIIENNTKECNDFHEDFREKYCICQNQSLSTNMALIRYINPNNITNIPSIAEILE